MTKVSIFDDFNKYTDTLLRRIIDDVELSKLLYYTSDDPLAEPDFDTSIIFDNNLFPDETIADIVTTPKTTLGVVVDEISPLEDNVKYASFEVKFYLLTHRSLQKIANQHMRLYDIMRRIDILFNNESGIGMYKLTLNRAYRIKPNEDYSGFIISYDATVMNQIKN